MKLLPSGTMTLKWLRKFRRLEYAQREGIHNCGLCGALACDCVFFDCYGCRCRMCIPGAITIPLRWKSRKKR